MALTDTKKRLDFKSFQFIQITWLQVSLEFNENACIPPPFVMFMLTCSIDKTVI